MRLSVIQLSPNADKAENIAQARAMIDGAMAGAKQNMLALPEMWTCIGGNRAEKFAAAEVLPTPGDEGGVAYEFLRGMARGHEIYLHGGSIGERDGDVLYNTSLVFSPTGEELARYRKIHLFDITSMDGQGYRESDTFGAGDTLVTCDVLGVKLGLAICYDLRFAELFLELRRKHVDLVMLPAAFTLQTGKDHWEVLLRARAIETQCWFAAPACWGPHAEANGETRHTYGHSMIVDPWGHVLARVSDGLGWATATVDRTFMARIRANMPVLDHRKLV